MASVRTMTAEFRAANKRLVGLAERDLLKFWASLDITNAVRARDELTRYLPTLTTLYGEAAAAVAADWYDELRTVQKVPGRFAARVANPFPTEYVEQRVRFGASHLFTATPLMMLPFLQGAVQEYVLQPGRDTIIDSTRTDPRARGWHRETSASACDFCEMLAGRGGVYSKESSASFASHGNCNCTARPSWDYDAPAVPASAYVASERTSAMTDEQKDAHNKAIRDYIESQK